MAALVTNDLDYLAARLHGRRSLLAEASRLDALCRLRTIADVANETLPGENVQTAAALQRRFVARFIAELVWLAAQTSHDESQFLHWLLIRFQIENLKVIVRGLLSHTAIADIRNRLVPLPEALEFDAEHLLAVDSIEVLASSLPRGELRDQLTRALAGPPAADRSFFIETALDHGYFSGLAVCLSNLGRNVGDQLTPLVCQEVDTFHLMLVARGRFTFNLKPERIMPFHVGGAHIPRGLFALMLNDANLAAVAGRIVGRVIDELPAFVDPASLETLARNRFLHLAHRAFRHSHTGFAAVVGYIGIRRIEIANLITLSEGIRLGMASDAIRARLIPRHDREAAHV
jgi:V/A-type H+-transporting ATPase subunit C